MFREYYSADELLAKGAIVSQCYSDRSDGKTFNIKERGLTQYLEDKSQYVYMRLFKTEITEAMYTTFMNEICDKKPELTKGYEFQGTKTKLLVRKQGKKEWDILAYFIPLTMVGKYKSILDVNRIKSIELDEAVPLDDIYPKDVVTKLLDFWVSVDRDRFTVRLNIFANKISPFSPYFDYWNLNLAMNGNKIRTYQNGALAVQIYYSEEHRTERKKSKFNDLIKGTAYEDFYFGGILNVIGIKRGSIKDAKYWSSFMTEKGEGSIYMKDDYIILSESKRKDGLLLTDKIYNTNRKEIMVKFGDFAKFLKRMYHTGSIRAETEKAYYMFEDILIKAGAK